MNITEYLAKLEHCTSKEQEEAVALEYVSSNNTQVQQVEMLQEISEKVAEITKYIVSLKTFKDTIVTVKDYCDARKVTRQYVYQEIKRGKFKTIDLPIFAEYQGKRIEVGKQKFLSF